MLNPLSKIARENKVTLKQARRIKKEVDLGWLETRINHRIASTPLMKITVTPTLYLSEEGYNAFTEEGDLHYNVDGTAFVLAGGGHMVCMVRLADWQLTFLGKGKKDLKRVDSCIKIYTGAKLFTDAPPSSPFEEFPEVGRAAEYLPNILPEQGATH